jgi:hypothetical protein
MKYLVYGINWDIDEEYEDEDLGLPETMQIPAEELLLEGETLDIIDQISQDELSDRISDRISDLTGFCNFGFEYKPI